MHAILKLTWQSTSNRVGGPQLSGVLQGARREPPTLEARCGERRVRDRGRKVMWKSSPAAGHGHRPTHEYS